MGSCFQGEVMTNSYVLFGRDKPTSSEHIRTWYPDLWMSLVTLISQKLATDHPSRLASGSDVCGIPSSICAVSYQLVLDHISRISISSRLPVGHGRSLNLFVGQVPLQPLSPPVTRYVSPRDVLFSNRDYF
jgi:hypothetical protein